jgi:hypothetical protein
MGSLCADGNLRIIVHVHAMLMGTGSVHGEIAERPTFGARLQEGVPTRATVVIIFFDILTGLKAMSVATSPTI